MPPIATFVPDASLVEALEKTLRIEAEPLATSDDVEESESSSNESLNTPESTEAE
jgi:hypothetical protein